MTDQTTTDDEHVCKPGASVYYCPTSGETESDCHGGFDVCCDRPDLHQSTDEACQQLAERLDAVRATAEAWIRPTMSAPTRTAGEHLLRVLSAEPGNRTDSTAQLPAAEARTRLLQALDASYCQALGHTPEGLLAAYEASRTQTVDPAALDLRQRAAWVAAGRCPMCGWDRTEGRLCEDCTATVRRLPSPQRRPWRRYEPPTPHAPIQGVGYTPAQLLGVTGGAHDDAAVLPATTNHDTDTSGFELRGDTEIRAAARREAIALLDQRASSIDAFASSDFGEEARAVRELTDVANELRRVADETAATETDAEPTAEEIARDHVTTLHLIGEQLSTIEGWFWEHLADVRAAEQSAAEARQDGAQP